MTAPLPHGHAVHDRMDAGDELARLAPTGAVLVIIGYCDGLVQLANDDGHLPDFDVATFLRNAADQAQAEAERLAAT